MPLERNAQHAEAERAELQRVVEALTRSPRLSHLLRYMGDKLFAGEVDQLNEYNIATEVLGRSKTVFNASEDAIARVEAHRLRKRLAAFYETEGKDHPIRVTLPTGSYVPVFVHKSAIDPLPIQPSSVQTSELESRGRKKRLFGWFVPGWRLLILAAVLALVASVSYVYFRSARSLVREKPNGSRVSSMISPSTPIQSDSASSPIRLLAGYSGPPRTDSAGRVWNPDQYFSGGRSWQPLPVFIARTSDPFLFENQRTGDFSYSIPLKPGTYELHLFFSTPVRASDGSYAFNVWINGVWALQAFSINEDALGADIADERIFRDVSPEKDGFLRIKFGGVTGPPTLNAIEILPGLPHAQLPIRLVMQSTPFTDREGRFWHSDDYFMSGQLSTTAHPLPNSDEPDLFSSERFGHFTYAIPVDTRDTYTLVLHFVEFYFGTGAPGDGGVGSRAFKVMCNGQTLLDNFDIFKNAGSLHEITKTFHHLKPSPQGKLNLTFEPIANNATVSGIEVLDESH
jgi:hypothetical protein